MVIHGPPLFNRTTSPVWNCSMGRTPVGERLSPAHSGPRLPTRRTRVLLPLPWSIMAYHACLQSTLLGETCLERGDPPRCVRLRPQASSATAATRVVGSPGPLSCSEGSVG